MTNEALVLQYQQGRDVNGCLEELYLNNMRLLKRYAKKYANSNDLEDLRQQAYIGLQTAAEKWKPDTGASFSTYAVNFIIRSIIRYKLECEKGIRVPEFMCSRIAHFDKAYMKYRDEHGKEPPDSYMMKVLNLTQDQIDEVKRVKSLMIIDSLDMPVDEEGNTIEVVDAENGIDNLMDDIERQELKEKLWGIVDGLPGREPEVLRLRYKNGKTLQGCSEVMGVTPERVRVVEERGKRRIRETKSRELTPYLHDFILQHGLRGTSLKSYCDHGFSSSVELTVEHLEEYMNNRLK